MKPVVFAIKCLVNRIAVTHTALHGKTLGGVCGRVESRKKIGKLRDCCCFVYANDLNISDDERNNFASCSCRLVVRRCLERT